MEPKAVLLNSQKDFNKYMKRREKQGFNTAQKWIANNSELWCWFPMYMINDFIWSYWYRHPLSNPNYEYFEIISLQQLIKNN